MRFIDVSGRNLPANFQLDFLCTSTGSVFIYCLVIWLWTYLIEITRDKRNKVLVFDAAIKRLFSTHKSVWNVNALHIDRDPHWAQPFFKQLGHMAYTQYGSIPAFHCILCGVPCVINYRFFYVSELKWKNPTDCRINTDINQVLLQINLPKVSLGLINWWP